MRSLSENKTPSQLIREAIGNKDSNLTIEDLINSFGSQSFGFMYIIMALPIIIPLPPGIGFIPAALLCIWALQRVLGKTCLWLPKVFSKLEISPKIINKIEVKALPFCEKLEKLFFNSRQTNMLKEVEIRLASLAVVFMSILIMLPTPFLNSIPAVIIILMGLTILNRNRKLLWLNMSFSLLALGFIGSTLYAGLDILFE
ncbi:MAG: exopolysaccharide biosynthesis protein [Syntrophomonadaceae bacterium]